MFSALLPLFPLLAGLIPLTRAATADEWRSRSVYQLLTDRFAPATDGATCNTNDRVYCGGTFGTVVSKLDYIQGMGYDAIWISPTGLNLEGNTIYGQAYHGFWTTNPTQINPHFGTSDDLKALSKAVHDRGMLLMVDVAINALASTSNDISQAGLNSEANQPLIFKNTADFHPPCHIKWGNTTSAQQCWLTNSGVYLMDLNQDTAEVADTLKQWAPGYASEYGIDGFRIDASKHMTKEFQHDFCTAAGTFCMGEVAGDNTALAASFMGNDGIDSVFGFGMQNGFVKCFTGTSPSSMQTLAGYIKSAEAYPDASVVGAFLDNQDLSRFNSLESDKTRVFNAIVGTFLYGGIPTIYYGLEQDISDGRNDPQNREALWLYNNYATNGETYQRIAKLNNIRKKLGAANADWLKAAGTTASWQRNDIAIQRADSLIVLTNRGSGATGSWQIARTKFDKGASVIDLLTCNTSTVSSDGSLRVTWTSGQPFVFVAQSTASSAGLCGSSSSSTSSPASSSSAVPASSTASSVSASISPVSSSTNPGAVQITSASASISAKVSATATDGATATATNTDTATDIATDTATDTATCTVTDTATGTATDTPTDTVTDTATDTVTDTATGTASDEATGIATDPATYPATATTTVTATTTQGSQASNVAGSVTGSAGAMVVDGGSSTTTPDSTDTAEASAGTTSFIAAGATNSGGEDYASDGTTTTTTAGGSSGGLSNGSQVIVGSGSSTSRTSASSSSLTSSGSSGGSGGLGGTETGTGFRRYGGVSGSFTLCSLVVGLIFLVL